MKYCESEGSRRESIGINGSEIVKKRRQSDGRLFQITWSLFADFSNASTIHGVKYLGERRRHWTEKVFWIIAFSASVIGCSLMIRKIYNKMQYSPVVEEHSTPLWQIPFPAVTICSETKVFNRFVNFTDAWYQVMAKDFPNNTTLSDEELKSIDALAQICDAHIFGKKVINSSLQESEIGPLLKKIAPNLTQTVVLCRWRNEMVNCTDYFKEILTEEGRCFTFNALDIKKKFKTEGLANDFEYSSYEKQTQIWSLEKGYETNDIETFPRRVPSSGARAGFTIVLQKYKPDIDYICRGPVQGFKILLHSPDDIPRVSKQYFRVPSMQEVLVSVKPHIRTTSEGLAKFSPETRQCYFNSERSLQFFRFYTQNNCELECLANYTVKSCGCAKFSMPRSNSTRICTQTDIECTNDAEDNLTLLAINTNLTTDTVEGGKSHCSCLPACTSISYDVELSQADFDYKSLFRSFKDNISQFDTLELARTTIYFKEAQFTTSKRSDLYGWIDFMADCGGLLGLFLGFSILSLVEIFYYFTLRPVCNLKQRRKRSNKKNQTL